MTSVVIFGDNYQMINNRELNIVVEEVKNYLCFLAETGCTGFDCKKKSLETIEDWGRDKTFIAETLEQIRADIGDCRLCKLSNSRKNIVFGAGSPKARLVFVGEGPGFEEDKTGEPFVGAAGKLLTKIIQAIKLTREQVYICNIIKCRPPGNRNPELDEIKACFPFLERQIAIISPDFICALGTFAAQILLETKEPISKLRGRFHDYKEIKLLPTYHPAYLLRSPDKKKDVWEDMKKLMNEMEK